jgi:hypothetical protein
VLHEQEPRPPQRASLRLKGIASDGSSVAEELRNGQIVVKGGAGKQAPDYQPYQEETKRPKPSGMP